MSEVKVYPDVASVVRATAELFRDASSEAIKSNGRFTVGLSGGNTPRPLYSLLATDEFAKHIEWSRIYVFWSDERCVLPTSPDSNYYMARETLLDYVPLPPENIYRIHGEDEPAKAATDYEQTLHDFFSDSVRFDFLLIGMGDDGHTASLFPHTKALDEKERLVVENYVEKLAVWRITFTPKAINAAKEVVFLVTGANKVDRLPQVINGEFQPHELPSQLIKPESGKLTWMLDSAAAAKL